MHTSNALDPQSPQARAIYDLGIVSTIIFVLVFVVVAAGIVYAIFRFRAREGEPDPKQFARKRESGNRLDGDSVPDCRVPFCADAARNESR